MLTGNQIVPACPCSWGEMLNSYRTTYGASAYSTVKGAVDVPPRFPRTSLTPFGDQHHKNVHSIGADYAQERYATEQKRHAYHGRGPSAPWLKVGMYGPALPLLSFSFVLRSGRHSHHSPDCSSRRGLC